MSDVHRWLRSRAAQLAGLGVAAVLVAVALGVAAQSRRDAAVAATQAKVRAALLADADAVAAALPLRPVDGVDVAVVDSLGGRPLRASSFPVPKLAARVTRLSPSGLTRQDGHAVGWQRVTTADGRAQYVLAYARHRPTLVADNLVPLLLALLTLLASAILVWTRHRSAARGATIDPVTRLPNRRQLLLALPRAIAAARSDAPVALVLLELNGFKSYNDRFGHQAGDKLLQLLARRVETSLHGTGTAYRLGGGEFCVVAPIDPKLGEDRLVVDTVAALTEHGDGFDIVPGCGVVVLPGEATEAAVALRIADQRLYANKQSGRRSASRQSTDVLLRALSERSPELGSHLHDVAELAGQVGARMGMSDEEIDQLLQAAELHDVGKMAIPDAILKKPGPLDQEEWRFIRGHTVIGERIVSAAPALAPVALLIRSSHERWDGSGYPDTLVGDRIPLGSRIIAVCDAFDAMIGPRPHRLGMTDEEALRELERCAGTQFDPEVVRVFAATFAELTRNGRAAA